MMADRPSRRAIGTLITAAASSTSASRRKPGVLWSMTVFRIQGRGAGWSRFRAPPSLTWRRLNHPLRRAAMRIALTCALTLLVLAAALAPAHAQSGFDRPGGDYTSFAVRSGDPIVCAARCEREGRC